MSESTHLVVEVETQVPWPLSEQDATAFTDKVLSAAANHLGISGEVSVLFVDDATIHELNRTYRSVDRPTDVLSFAMQEGDEFPDLDGPTMLGDIVVSIDKAKEQADAYGHSLERELAFLLVHGFLHLNGYDHQDEQSEQEMFGLQEEILVELGLVRSESK
ncbi:rRNA maturation RNase YbeY [Alicyclobacillus dauci]|uniref:Endoribonuclease YbeY n=1 Tax=Alicyclobacillus dauci TaxID=1475485 RepID=A0ABY6Z8H0_9BACL|nr:rRNA maturation RNase YbeY [Alicyclobacillus dauci]WAH38549.1 rRNA maturation RNase YbeY [Alicyclobacillus dauci]